MRMTVKRELGELSSKMLGYISVMSYKFAYLCVKADPSSLLSIEENIGDQNYRIEDMCDIYVHEEEQEKDIMDLYPKEDFMLQPIIRSVMSLHPEFKITIMKYDPEVSDEDNTEENTYVRLTMPVVDEERRKLCLDAAEVIYQTCCSQMDELKTRKIAKIATLTITDSPQAQQEAKDLVEKADAESKQMREQVYEEKKQEIEEAYQRYLNDQASQQSTNHTDNAVTQSMKASENLENGNGLSMKLN